LKKETWIEERGLSREAQLMSSRFGGGLNFRGGGVGVKTPRV